MHSVILRWFQGVAVVALLLGATAPAFAVGEPPLPPAFEGTGGIGHDPDNPLAINGIVRNTLAPGQATWFQTAYGGPAPLAVTVSYNPTNLSPASLFQMRVNWATPNGMPSTDWPGLFRVGEGTPSKLPPGVLYWATSEHTSAAYLIEVVNNSTVPVGYAIAVTGPQFPPPELNPAPPGVIAFPT
jgi:hypothetical protein